MALLTWMIRATWQQRRGHGQDLMLQILFMVALIIIGHFGGSLAMNPVSFVWVSLLITHMIGMGWGARDSNSLPTALLMHNIPLIAWVWVQVLAMVLTRGLFMTGFSLLVLGVYGPVSWVLALVIGLSLIPLILYRLLMESMMGAGVLGFVWLCPLLTPLLIFGLDTVQRAASGTLTFAGGTVYGLMYLLFCIAVLPWIVAWMMKERMTS
jgi:hypothetical protein